MIYVKESVFNLENKEFAIWITLLYMRQVSSDTTCVTMDALSYNMYGEPVSNSVKYKDFNVAKKYGVQHGKTLVVDNRIFDRNDGEHFARVDYDDVRKILMSDHKNKFFLVKYYCWLMKSVNNNTDVGHQSMSYFANVMDCSERTIINCNKQLEELGVIYINHNNDLGRNKSGKLSSASNYYGSVANKQVIDKATNGKNNTKSIGNKIAWLRRGKKYSDQEVQEMYDYVVNWNKKLLDNKKKCSNYAGELKSLDVFDGYNIVRDEEYELFN